MSQDIVSDALNQIMNAKKARKQEVIVSRSSKFLVNLLNLFKEQGYLDFKSEDKKIIIKLKKINECRTIKPRFNVSVNEIDKYVRRFLPARNFGKIIISTSKGLMPHTKAIEENLGGGLIAYIY